MYILIEIIHVYNKGLVLTHIETHVNFGLIKIHGFSLIGLLFLLVSLQYINNSVIFKRIVPMILV